MLAQRLRDVGVGRAERDEELEELGQREARSPELDRHADSTEPGRGEAPHLVERVHAGDVVLGRRAAELVQVWGELGEHVAERSGPTVGCGCSHGW